MEVLLGQVLIGGTWKLAITAREHQHQIFPDNRPLGFERVLVFKFWLCPGSLILWRRCVEGDEILVLGAKSPPLGMFQPHELWFWSVVPEKQLGTSSNWIGPFSVVLWLQ